MDTPRHVVLAKPGDVLIIGNIGDLPAAQIKHAGRMFEHLGIQVVLFAANIDLAALPAPAAPEPE